MLSRDDQRERTLDLLAGHLLQKGLSETSLRQLARAAQVSDRMLLYYFRDKAEVLAATMERIAGQIAVQLAGALDGGPFAPGAFMVLAAELTTGGELRPFMRLWIEVVAAAARREDPFVDIAARIAGAFLAWIEMRLDVADPHQRQAAAAVILATIDGLALLEVCAGEQLTARAVRAMPGMLSGPKALIRSNSV